MTEGAVTDAAEPTATPDPQPRPGLLTAVLDWLRAGYPEGVPPTDYVPLLALLRPRLSDEDLDRVVQELEQADLLPADRAEIASALEKVVGAEPTREDVSRVAGRLAAAGWPLAVPDTRPEPRQTLLGSVIDWLRAGYPEGVPAQDYIPLLALLRRRLSDDEIKAVADEILKDGSHPFGTADIGVLITKVTNELPSEEDVARVRERLEAAGATTERH